MYRVQVSLIPRFVGVNWVLVIFQIVQVAKRSEPWPSSAISENWISLLQMPLWMVRWMIVLEGPRKMGCCPEGFLRVIPALESHLTIEFAWFLSCLMLFAHLMAWSPYHQV